METTKQIICKENGSLDVDAYKNLVGNMDIGGFIVDVVVVDARLSYGRLDFCIAPKSGNGTQWVSAVKVSLTGDRTFLTTASRKKRTTVTSALKFREVVARQKAKHMNSDAEVAFVNHKSILDLLIKEKEENNEY